MTGTAGWLRLPPDLVKDNKADFLGAFAQLRVRAQSDGSWSITTEERYKRTGSPTLEIVLLARGTDFGPEAGAQLAGLQRLDQVMRPEHLADLRRLRAHISTTRPGEPLWARFTGQAQLAPDADLLDVLTGVQASGAADDSLWLVESPPVLVHRLTLMRAFFAARHAPDAWTTRRSFEGFASCRALMTNSVAGFMLYLLPPLLYAAPWICGTAVGCTNGTIVRLLAQPEPGRPTTWGSPLDSLGAGRMYEAPGVPALPREPQESLADREAFLVWWTERVAELLTLLSDFDLYRDAAGDYDPARHLGAVLTAERLFLSAVEAIRLRTIGELLRKLLLFDVLDLMDGQGMGTHEDNLHYGKQLTAWHDLEPALPEAARRCVAPLIEGGFEALRDVEKALCAPSRRSGDSIALDRKSGPGQEAVSIDRARGEYIRILRDTHHGYKKLVGNKRDLSYLASFTGELSQALPDLVWWYLVRLLTQPRALLAPA